MRAHGLFPKTIDTEFWDWKKSDLKIRGGDIRLRSYILGGFAPRAPLRTLVARGFSGSSRCVYRWLPNQPLFFLRNLLSNKFRLSFLRFLELTMHLEFHCPMVQQISHNFCSRPRFVGSYNSFHLQPSRLGEAGHSRSRLTVKGKCMRRRLASCLYLEQVLGL